MTRALLTLLVFASAGTSPALAQPRATPPVVAPPPTSPCASLEACTEALARGHYESAAGGLETLRRGRAREAATVALARVRLETGRYEEAADLARPLASAGAQRIPAATLLGEAEAARGRLDEAQRALESVSGEATAHRARVMLGRLLARRGRTAAAETVLMRLVQAYNDQVIGERDAEGLAYVGMAAAMLDSPHDANGAFEDSTRADPRRAETQLEWTRLFLSHYDPGHAEESVRVALEANPHHPVAHALLARIELERSLDFVAAERELAAALAVNPSLVMAHVTRAGVAIRDMDLALAEQHLARALAIDPTDLEALSVRAALLFLADDVPGHRRAVQEVLRIHPTYSELYTIIAEYADWEHRYAQVAEMAREGVRLDPSDALAHATLGLSLLRMGREEEGLVALREAWRRDRFNVRVYNTLNLYDDVLGSDYERIEAAPFVLRLHREERAVMEPAILRVLGGAWADMRRRYGFTPVTPVHLEMFSDNEHFSVRTSGLPNIGVQGVCFGQVITAVSPRVGSFDWGQITWHELAHVFHLQMSNNRVPRWFTEGLAEYETILARPEWRREEDHRLYLALASDRLPPVRTLNHAFTHARTGEDITIAYYASSMVVKYIGERFGFPVLVRMLREWGRGQSSEQVVQTALGIDIDALDRDFRAHTRERLAGRARDFAVDLGAHADLEAARRNALASPADAEAHARLAASLAVNGELEPAREAMHRALRLDRTNALARYLGARLALERGDARTARADLRLLREAGHDGYELRLDQARIALGMQRGAEAREALEAAARIDPERPEAWQGLVEIAGGPRDADLRLTALRRLVEVDQHDRASHGVLLRLLRAREAWAELRTYGARTIFVDPHNAASRALYAEALLEGGQAAEALEAADGALAAQPEQPGPVHALRARALAALRRTREARAAAGAAIAADPSLAEQLRTITGR